MFVLIQVSSMKTRREAVRARLRAISGRSCSAGRIAFEAQLLGVNERPHRPHICLDPARSQFLRQLPQSEWSRANAFAQPFGVGARQNRLLVTADLAGRNASGLRRRFFQFVTQEGLI
ncbi:hypothetical protein [Bradyrhizobium sp. RDM4]|uniref:hypothetical protein n=1 Tax=Bradyrhizobium sp. RDM4 TaxID=3378765 RepID=UPI0038FC9AE9